MKCVGLAVRNQCSDADDRVVDMLRKFIADCLADLYVGLADEVVGRIPLGFFRTLKPRSVRGPLFHRASIRLVKQAQAAAFFLPQIDHFVMAITAAEAIVRHIAPHQTA
jgi:hypothetical protein